MNPNDNIPPNGVRTRCIFFRHENTTLLESQINYFLTYAQIENLVHINTTIYESSVLITLWIVPAIDAQNIDKIYAEALAIAKF